MMDNTLKIFAPSKVSVHQDRINSYLNGEKIYPITIELDLTQHCTRNCPGCPYSAQRQAGHTLQLPFLERLFSVLGPHTPGIVLSGGEPTYAPHFPEIVDMAKAKGFKEIAVISNGTRLDVPEVREALLKNVTSVRISMYDWQEGDTGAFKDTLNKISSLRDSVKKEGSSLEIGAAMLTRKEWNDRIAPVGIQVLNSGVDWLYFHPYCIDWGSSRPIRADQSGVIEAIKDLAMRAPKGANIQVPYERYLMEPLFFNELHGAHFLIQIGADGVNYAGPECKYHKEYALLDLNEHMSDDFLWHPQRLKRLKEINSSNYSVIGTKHRPPMFSDYIEKLIREQGSKSGLFTSADKGSFLYPEII